MVRPKVSIGVDLVLLRVPSVNPARKAFLISRYFVLATTIFIVHAGPTTRLLLLRRGIIFAPLFLSKGLIDLPQIFHFPWNHLSTHYRCFSLIYGQFFFSYEIFVIENCVKKKNISNGGHTEKVLSFEISQESFVREKVAHRIIYSCGFWQTSVLPRNTRLFRSRLAT